MFWTPQTLPGQLAPLPLTNTDNQKTVFKITLKDKIFCAVQIFNKRFPQISAALE